MVVLLLGGGPAPGLVVGRMPVSMVAGGGTLVSKVGARETGWVVMVAGTRAGAGATELETKARRSGEDVAGVVVVGERGDRTAVDWVVFESARLRPSMLANLPMPLRGLGGSSVAASEKSSSGGNGNGRETPRTATKGRQL